MKFSNRLICAVLLASPLAFVNIASAQAPQMTFFVTSTGSGKGADLGGLAGADQLCQTRAAAAGAGARTWRAYLSTTATAGGTATNARDRIGAGPWHNAKGELIALNVEELHTANKITKQTALTEKGEVNPGRGDPVNQHDILTGSTPDGRAITGTADTTCGNWTKSGEGSAMLGHADRLGLTDDAPAKSWNSSHPSRGCSQDNLKSTGGAGLLYCFAEK
ncbi:hypothetical protein PY365_33035 [Roseiarcaceae bacterium H3SJ34-1]|uniref:hypothetical protein n=1 Tax=Terripilifer ovatus TaxID=3032367 RepID=UPI003AB93D6E|nr:hypothetical protein [Roseiarcaceae bacterium H3SJ34-1]